MITAGIDLGIENVKAVVLKDGRILARSIVSSGGSDRANSADFVWKEALQTTGLKPEDVNKVVATGQGKGDVRFANDRVVEALADIKAAFWLFPATGSVVDIGADHALAANFDDKGTALDSVLNLKCAAGLGIFLKSMARTLGLTLDQMSLLSSESSKISINDRCAVYAELDALWLIQEKTPKQEIVQAINEAISTKINSMLNEKLTLHNKAVLIGGVAKNNGVVKALQKRSGINFMIPEYPEFAGALGAALLAAS
jgi:predicted CoA-substrate-specific enzyme activase